MNINYQIIKEQLDGKYYPDYDKLIKNATDEAEKEYIKRLQDINYGFTYNMVYITKQRCGHYEIFQMPQNSYYTLEENLDNAKIHALDYKCTRCICNF